MKNKENGITLIALIITIIVMLILVGVTINVALNGGLFDKAKTTSYQTQREIEREQLISTMIGAYNSRGKFVIGEVGTLPEETKWCLKTDTDWRTTEEITPTENGNWVITKNNNKFYINEDGTVLDDEPETNIDSLIPTPEQLAEATFIMDQGDYVFDDDFFIIYESFMDLSMVLVKLENEDYITWCCDETTATELEVEKAYTWYYSSRQPYTDSCPISLETLQNLKNENGYITRVINSFNN